MHTVNISGQSSLQTEVCLHFTFWVLHQKKLILFFIFSLFSMKNFEFIIFNIERCKIPENTFNILYCFTSSWCLLRIIFLEDENMIDIKSRQLELCDVLLCRLE